MRGEECRAGSLGNRGKELPPHARRRVIADDKVPANSGITSACAEKSFSTMNARAISRNYLRMRGEEVLIFCMTRK